MKRTQIATKTKSKIMEKAGWKCYVCGNKNVALEIHHILPVMNGGANNKENLVALCHSCHKAIHNDNIEQCIFNAIKACVNERTRKK